MKPCPAVGKGSNYIAAGWWHRYAADTTAAAAAGDFAVTTGSFFMYEVDKGRLKRTMRPGFTHFTTRWPSNGVLFEGEEEAK